MPQKLYKWSLKCLCLASKLLSQHYGKKWRTYRLLLFLWDLTLQIINVQKLCLWQNRHLKGLLLTIFRSISTWSAGFTSPTKRVYSFLANLEINETVCYILFIMFITGNASHFINMKLTTSHAQYSFKRNTCSPLHHADSFAGATTWIQTMTTVIWLIMYWARQTCIIVSKSNP